MRVFVAGGTGVIGRLCVRILVAAGHEVVGMARTEESASRLARLGARAVIVDAFDRAGVRAIVAAERPDAIISQLTDLASSDLEANARLRIEGMRNLIDAAKDAGTARIVVQSIAFAYGPGEGPAREDDPLDTGAPAPRARTIEGVTSLERAAAELPEEVILRYGRLYGPGTWLGPGGAEFEQIRRGTFTSGDGVSSFVHLRDAALAASCALRWPPGVFNIVDDEPARASQWAPFLARELGAPLPEIRAGARPHERGASNGKARREAGWLPLFATWRDGFRYDLTDH